MEEELDEFGQPRVTVGTSLGVNPLGALPQQAVPAQAPQVPAPVPAQAPQVPAPVPAQVPQVPQQVAPTPVDPVTGEPQSLLGRRLDVDPLADQSLLGTDGEPGQLTPRRESDQERLLREGTDAAPVSGAERIASGELRGTEQTTAGGFVVHPDRTISVPLGQMSEAHQEVFARLGWRRVRDASTGETRLVAASEDPWSDLVSLASMGVVSGATRDEIGAHLNRLPTPAAPGRTGQGGARVEVAMQQSVSGPTDPRLEARLGDLHERMAQANMAAAATGINLNETLAEGQRALGELREIQAQEIEAREAGRGQQYRERLERMDQSIEDLRSRRVDPEQFFGQGGEGFARRLGSAVAVALGAMGQGLARLPTNSALDIINRRIGESIEAQQANIDNERSALGHEANALGYYRALLGDERAAEHATRAAMLEAAVQRIQANVTRARSPQMAANAASLILSAQAQQTAALLEAQRANGAYTIAQRIRGPMASQIAAAAMDDRNRRAEAMAGLGMGAQEAPVEEAPVEEAPPEETPVQRASRGQRRPPVAAPGSRIARGNVPMVPGTPEPPMASLGRGAVGTPVRTPDARVLARASELSAAAASRAAPPPNGTRIANQDAFARGWGQLSTDMRQQLITGIADWRGAQQGMADTLAFISQGRTASGAERLYNTEEGERARQAMFQSFLAMHRASGGGNMSEGDRAFISEAIVNPLEIFRSPGAANRVMGIYDTAQRKFFTQLDQAGLVAESDNADFRQALQTITNVYSRRAAGEPTPSARRREDVDPAVHAAMGEMLQ